MYKTTCLASHAVTSLCYVNTWICTFSHGLQHALLLQRKCSVKPGQHVIMIYYHIDVNRDTLSKTGTPMMVNWDTSPVYLKPGPITDRNIC